MPKNKPILKPNEQHPRGMVYFWVNETLKTFGLPKCLVTTNAALMQKNINKNTDYSTIGGSWTKRTFKEEGSNKINFGDSVIYINLPFVLDSKINPSMYHIDKALCHEVGHYFEDYYKGKLFTQEELNKVFGEPNDFQATRLAYDLHNILKEEMDDLEETFESMYVSSYAATCSREDFAETFGACYMAYKAGALGHLRKQCKTKTLKKKCGWVLEQMQKIIVE